MHELLFAIVSLYFCNKPIQPIIARGPTLIPNHVECWKDSGIRNLNFH